MSLSNPEIWLTFFRIGFLCFTVLCTAVALIFCANLVIEAGWRLLKKAYGFQAMLEASRELHRQGKAPKFKRFIDFSKKYDDRF